MSAVSAPITNAIGSAILGDVSTTTGQYGGGAASDWANANPVGASLVQAGVGALTSGVTRMATVGGRLSWEAVAANTLSGAISGYYQAQNSRIDALVDKAKATYQDARSAGASFEEAYKSALGVQDQEVAATDARLATARPRLQTLVQENIKAYPSLAGGPGTHTAVEDIVGLQFVGARSSSMSLGYLNESVSFTQYADNNQTTDAYTGGVRQFDPSIDSATRSLLKELQQSIHGLSGKSVLDMANAYLDIIDKYSDNPAIAGFAIHGLGDLPFHSTYEGNDFGSFLVSKTYEAPIGHGLQGSSPDYLTEFKLEAVVKFSAKAYADISGVSQSDFDEIRINLKTMTDNFSSEVGQLSGEERDAAFIKMYRAVTGGSRFDPGAVKLDSPWGLLLLPGQNVTYDTEFAYTKEFLNSTPLRTQNRITDEFAQNFMARGLEAAKTISNELNTRFNWGYKPITGQNFGLKGTRI